MHVPDADSMLRLIKGLEQMRDSLVELSLTLEDIRFEYDVVNRVEASRSATQILRRIGVSEGDLPI